MLNEQDYLIAWLFYLGAALGVYGLIAWKLRRWRFKTLQLSLRAVLAVLLFTPVVLTGIGAQQHDSVLAPAHLSAIFAFSQSDFELAERATVNLALVAFVLALMFLVRALLKRVLGDKLVVNQATAEQS